MSSPESCAYAPCGCCPYCGALPGHQHPPTGEVWQHKHSPVREPMAAPDAVDLQRRIERTLLFIAEVAMEYPAHSAIYGAWMAAARSLKTPVASADYAEGSL